MCDTAFIQSAHPSPFVGGGCGCVVRLNLLTILRVRRKCMHPPPLAPQSFFVCFCFVFGWSGFQCQCLSQLSSVHLQHHCICLSSNGVNLFDVSVAWTVLCHLPVTPSCLISMPAVGVGGRGRWQEGGGENGWLY